MHIASDYAVCVRERERESSAVCGLEERNAYFCMCVTEGQSLSIHLQGHLHAIPEHFELCVNAVCVCVSRVQTESRSLLSRDLRHMDTPLFQP